MLRALSFLIAGLAVTDGALMVDLALVFHRLSKACECLITGSRTECVGFRSLVLLQ